VPALNLTSEPKSDMTPWDTYHWPRHVSVPTLVGSDAVPVRQAEDFRDASSIDQIVGVHTPTHELSL